MKSQGMRSVSGTLKGKTHLLINGSAIDSPKVCHQTDDFLVVANWESELWQSLDESFSRQSGVKRMSVPIR